MKLILAFLIFWIVPISSAGSEMYIYLNPSVEASHPIQMKVLGVFEGGGATDLVLKSVIPPSAYKDGYIDVRELRKLINQLSGITPVIYGSAVKITAPVEKNIDTFTNAAGFNAGIEVKRDETVICVYKKGRIKIEFTGKALKAGTDSDIILVKTRYNKTVSVKIIGSGKVEVLR